MKDDTTERVLSCGKMPPHQLTQDDFYNVKDIGLWRKIIEPYMCNDRLHSDCGVQKSFENRTGTSTE